MQLGGLGWDELKEEVKKKRKEMEEEILREGKGKGWRERLSRARQNHFVSLLVQQKMKVEQGLVGKRIGGLAEWLSGWGTTVEISLGLA